MPADNQNYIFCYADAQNVTYSQLKFIIHSNVPGFGIFRPYGKNEDIQLSIDRIKLNEHGLKLAGDNTACDMYSDVKKFHQKFGMEYDGPPRELEPTLHDFRKKFIDEEMKEFKTAQNSEQELDAIIDLIYVLIGYALLRGWKFKLAWQKIHEKNMLKTRSKQGDKARHSTDVVKPAGWTAPDLKDCV